MSYARKTRDYWGIYAWYKAYGWEAIDYEETLSAARRSVREYRENDAGTPYKILKQRERIAPEG